MDSVPSLTLCDPMDCSPPDSSVYGILQARILEWVAISFSRGSSWPRDQTRVSCVSFFACTASREAQLYVFQDLKNPLCVKVSEAAVRDKGIGDQEGAEEVLHGLWRDLYYIVLNIKKSCFFDGLWLLKEIVLQDWTTWVLGFIKFTQSAYNSISALITFVCKRESRESMEN